MAKKEHGSGSGTEMVYVVEARSVYSEPQQINGMLLDNRWREVLFQQSTHGVRNAVWNAQARAGGFLDYKAALTLAHWFLANGERAFCAEVRIVKIRFESHYKTEEVGVSAPMSLFGSEREAKFHERDEQAAAVDAVDPQAASTGKPSTRA